MERHLSKEPYAIFDVTDEIKQVTLKIIEALQQENEELVEERFEDLIDLINSYENKYQSVAYIIVDSRNLAKKYQAKASAYRYLARRLKERLHDHMNQQELKDFDTGIFRLWIKDNLYPTVIVDIPAEELPKEFHSIRPDKVKLREALSKGEKIEGVTLESGEHLTITVKVSLK